MKVFAFTALFATAIAAPLEERDINSTTVSNVDVGPGTLPAHVPHLYKIFTSETPAPADSPIKRKVEIEERSLVKRAITLDVWQDINRGGRHEGLISDLNRCYNLGNGWNDAISSLQLPPDVGCYFYVDSGCPTSGAWLSISKSSSFVFLNAPDWGYNDKISSYLCYN